ncbi:S8 family serine peptidase [Crossiella cryophila]|uniref:Subtilisin family serine protease n=1 Tax=Crossiella cryophila TaxID=43355 RepID=A0A7W7C7Q4_9PSEU|nr:S8 family serine peptidase [Crossiella cryophila]MBB4676033.1 subtilisin family serine protease [Crossiella cryophila]
MASALATGSAAAAPAPEARPGPDVPVRTAELTLVTGDTVTLDYYPDGRQAARVKGSEQYRSYTLDKQAYVVPFAAEPYLAAGVLDERLFNVTKLVEQGFDRQGSLPLILSYPKQDMSIAAAPPRGSARQAVLASASAQAVRAERGKMGEFWGALAGRGASLNGGIAKVWLDGKVQSTLDTSVPQVGAPAAWQAGFDGTGGTVAVLDTGIDDTHPDLAGKVVEHKNFSDAPAAEDKHGHGTHVASTIAGSGAASGGAKKGVAPGAKLLSGKVLNDGGSGSESGIIAGMEWAAGKAKVVSMSLGGGPTDGTDPMSVAVNRISADTGALFVIAAGNSGFGGQETVSSPGTADSALTVAAVDKQDQLAPFSSKGPRFGDHALKPDIAAPGVAISAAKANSAGGERYVSANGTSMATPHVAGAAAILAQRNPKWTPAQLKTALMQTAKPLNGISTYDQGAGRLEAGVAATAQQQLRADAGSLSLGRFLGPYGSVDPVTRKVTYTNDGSAEATLDLTVQARSAGGATAPAEALSVSPATLSIPAGGSATATVTLNPNAGEVGLYTGALTATQRGGAAVLRTVLGFNKDLQHKVSVTATARDGKAPGYASVALWNLDDGKYHRVNVDATGSGGLLLPPGKYFVGSFLSTADPSRNDTEYTVVTKDEVEVKGSTSIVLDGRGAKEIQARTPEKTEAVTLSQTWTRASGARRFTSGFFYGRTVDRIYAVPSAPVTRGEFELANRMWLETPKLAARVVSPDTVLRPDYLGGGQELGKRIDGTHRLPVVYVGTGTPAEFAGRDVRGKIALIQQSKDITPNDQVRNAANAKAGVAAVFGSGPGRFADYTTRNPAIPGLELSNVEGKRLLELLGRGPVTLELKGVSHSPVQYHLVAPFAGSIPADLSFDASPATLATERTKLHAVRPDQVGMLGMFSFRPYDFIGLTSTYDRRFPYDHVRYFSANNTRFNPLFYGGPDGDSVAGNGSAPLPVAGSDRTVNWYQGPFQPGVSKALVPVSRVDDKLRLNFAEYLDSDPDHYLRDLGASTVARVYRDGEQVAEQPHALGELAVGVADKANYRVELDVNQGRPGWSVGTESFSSWSFGSARGEAGKTVPLPVLQARWNLDLDLDNAAPADRVHALNLTAATQPGAPPVKVTEVRAEVSYNDGGSWEAVDLRALGSDGGYSGAIQHPRKADSSGFVSLKVQAADAEGNSVEQTLIRAYALK